jgi:DNA polymerase III alpha subunit
MTYYEEQWICAYLESMSHTPDQRAKAFGEVRALGYQIVPIDINQATMGWTVLPGKKLMPSMTSVKGVGDSAVEEIMEKRPFKSIEDMLYNEDGTWRLSKFNRKAMEALIKVRAFGSLQCVGPDKIFKSYRHMYETLMGSCVEIVEKKKGSGEFVERVRDHSTLIKRSSKNDPYEGKKNFYELARKLAETHSEEWSQAELAEFQVEFFGTADVTMMFDQKYFDKFNQMDIPSIEDLEIGDTKYVWFVTVLAAVKKGGEPQAGIKKTTKNGKEYVQAFVTGPIGKPLRINVWGKKELFEPFKLCIAEVKRDDYGFSTASFKVKVIE